MRVFTVSLTVLSSVTVAAPDTETAITEARRFAEASQPEGHFVDGWNDIQRENGAPLILDASSVDIEGVEPEDVADMGARWEIAPQFDLHAGTELQSEGTRFEDCPEEIATQWTLFQREADGDTALVEDYPTRQQAEAARDALASGGELPAPVWPATPAVTPAPTAYYATGIQEQLIITALRMLSDVGETNTARAAQELADMLDNDTFAAFTTVDPEGAR